MAAWRRVAAGVAVVLLAGGGACTGDDEPSGPVGVGVPTAATSPGAPVLGDARRCTDADDFSCFALTVPIDRSGTLTGRLELGVAVAGNADAPRGTLLFLTGGPGQPGVSYLPRIRQRAGYLLDDYRLVMIDQRGTGPDAIDCPKLQDEVGSSDVTPPSAGAVQECADLIGPAREFYTTADTVADLDDLRRALGIEKWTIAGVSYGSFVAARYGLTYPANVERLVLDSVVQQDGVGALYTEGMARAAWVLRKACEEQSCGYDPAEELAAVVRRHGNGVGVFDLLVIASIVDPKLTGSGFFPVLELLHQAAGGDAGPLDQAIEDLRADATPHTEFSAGLHAATLCADQVDLPWGNPTAPLDQRAAALDTALAAIPADVTWPFTPETAVDQGLVQTCVPWPPTRANPAPPSGRLTMPVLLLAGDRDLSTPLAWAEQQKALAPDAELVVVAGMGHSIIGRHPAGDAAIRKFLLV